VGQAREGRHMKAGTRRQAYESRYSDAGI
jgi:hypothetical protein